MLAVVAALERQPGSRAVMSLCRSWGLETAAAVFIATLLPGLTPTTYNYSEVVIIAYKEKTMSDGSGRNSGWPGQFMR